MEDPEVATPLAQIPMTEHQITCEEPLGEDEAWKPNQKQRPPDVQEGLADLISSAGET